MTQAPPDQRYDSMPHERNRNRRAERAVAAESFATRDDGLVTWSTAVAVVFFLVLTNLVINVGLTIDRKIEVQDSADSLAYSSAVHAARGMNAVAAANHMIGELTALYVLHHSFGGDWLDENGRNSSDYARRKHTPYLIGGNIALGIAGGILMGCPEPARYSDVKVVLMDPIGSEGSTFFLSKCVLKLEMAFWYGVHGVAWYYLNYPGMRFAREQETATADEYRKLNSLEDYICNLIDLKLDAVYPLLNIVWQYEQDVVKYTPLTILHASSNIAESNRTKGFVYFSGLPVELDPTEEDRRSQLMRATYPWVHVWRGSIFYCLLINTPRSMSGPIYLYVTNEYSKKIVGRFRTEGCKLFTIKGMNAPEVDKGNEPWTGADGSEEADDLFCMLGFARTEEKGTFANTFYRQSNPDGIVCFSQAIIYNANDQQPPGSASSRDGKRQPKVGWDTLAWVDDKAIEHDVLFEIPSLPTFDGSFETDISSVLGILSGRESLGEVLLRLSPIKPQNVKINLAWKAKLVPVTQNKLTKSRTQVFLHDRETFSSLSERFGWNFHVPLELSPH